MINKYTIDVPLTDVNGNYISQDDVNTMIASIENISSDTTTRQSAGIYFIQNNVMYGDVYQYYWYCDDSNQSAIESAYATLRGLYSWGKETMHMEYAGVSTYV